VLAAIGSEVFPHLGTEKLIFVTVQPFLTPFTTPIFRAACPAQSFFAMGWQFVYNYI